MKPLLRVCADGSIQPILRPFERDKLRKMLTAMRATPAHIMYVALQEFQAPKEVS